MARLSLDDGADALRWRKLDLRLHQFPRAGGIHWLSLQPGGPCDEGPVYARRAVPNSRQHQSVIRVSVTSLAVGRICDESRHRFAGGDQSVPYQHGSRWFRIRVLAARIRDVQTTKGLFMMRSFLLMLLLT